MHQFGFLEGIGETGFGGGEVVDFGVEVALDGEGYGF